MNWFGFLNAIIGRPDVSEGRCIEIIEVLREDDDLDTKLRNIFLIFKVDRVWMLVMMNTLYIFLLYFYTTNIQGNDTKAINKC